MTRLITQFVLALALTAPLFAQTPAAQPQPKSQEELDALIAIQEAQDPNVRIAASEKLLTDFADTEFKEFANYMMMLSHQQLNDYENMLLFGERTLEINPDNVGVLLQLSLAIPTRTREFDLDKDEKLAKAEDFARRATTLVPNLPKPSPDVPDEEWLMTKKDFMAQANEALGVVALRQKNYDEAVASLTKAIDLAVEQVPMTFYHLAEALHGQGKNPEALNAAEKALAGGGSVAQLAEDLKKKIEAGN
jgi:tetratricopeptide (TPR) repeat protein